MGTEVLRPQDCLIERLRSPPSSPFHFPRRRIYHPTPKPTTTTTTPKKQPPRRQQRSKSEPLITRNYHSTPNEQSNNKVTILRRGESLDSKSMKTQMRKSGYGSDPERNRIGSPDPVDMYAGSAFSLSPEPSDVPLPSFSKKKQIPFDDFATRDLRRLLRLD